MEKFKIEVDKWGRTNETVTSSTGLRYVDTTTSKITRTEVLEGTKEEIFLNFYKMNNSLRYCNGSYYTFKDKEIEAEYRANLSKINTFENYYGSGTVD